MSTIITKNSATSGSIPSSLVQGELAINVKDGRLFYGSGSGNIVKEFTGSGGGSGTPGGSNTQIQYNNAGAFGATSSFAFIPSSQSFQQGDNVIASGLYSHAEGLATTSTGSYSHAEGNGVGAVGNYSHAEGKDSNSIGDTSHTEGEGTITYGYGSHAEGSSNIASASFSHAEGESTITYGYGSHTEGASTSTNGDYSHAEGNSTQTTGYASHAEGNQTYTHGIYSHAEGFNTQAGRNNGYLATAAVAGDIVLDSTYGNLTGVSLFTPGYIAAVDDSAYDNVHTYVPVSVLSCSFDGTNTHVYTTDAINTTTLIVASLTQQLSNTGTYTWGGLAAHSEGGNSISTGVYAHSEGNGLAYGGTSHAEAGGTAVGDGTHAEGGATAVGNYSHAEGQGVTYAGYTHAEGSAQAGYLTLNPNTPITAGVFELDPAYGDLTSIFAAGAFVLINNGDGSITGTASTYLFEIASSTYNATPATQITLVNTTVATINNKFGVGVYGNALPPGVALSQDGIGVLSHAEGENTQAIGRASHASGYETRALGWYQTVVGKHNQLIPTPGAFIVGDGIDDATKHNLLVAASGSVTISGSLLVSGSITSTNGVATKSNVVPNTGFGGSPLTASVTFATAFPNTNYAVVITGEDARIWNIKNKTASSFIIESNSSIALTGDTFWHATGYGEFNG